MTNELDCNIVLSSNYDAYFQTNNQGNGMNPFIPSPAMGGKVWLFSIYGDGFGIKWPTKLDTSWNKETKPFCIYVNTSEEV